MYYAQNEGIVGTCTCFPECVVLAIPKVPQLPTESSLPAIPIIDTSEREYRDALPVKQVYAVGHVENSDLTLSRQTVIS